VGCRSKVVAAEMATAAGIPAVIANGQIAGTISAAVRGQDVGTTFLARVDRVSSFKLWLKYAKPARGACQSRRRRRPGTAGGRDQPATGRRG